MQFTSFFNPASAVWLAIDASSSQQPGARVRSSTVCRNKIKINRLLRIYDLIKIPVRDSLRCSAFHRDAGAAACRESCLMVGVDTWNALGSSRSRPWPWPLRGGTCRNDFVSKLLISIPHLPMHTVLLSLLWSPGKNGGCSGTVPCLWVC